MSRGLPELSVCGTASGQLRPVAVYRAGSPHSERSATQAQSLGPRAGGLRAHTGRSARGHCPSLAELWRPCRPHTCPHVPHVLASSHVCPLGGRAGLRRRELYDGVLGGRLGGGRRGALRPAGPARLAQLPHRAIVGGARQLQVSVDDAAARAAAAAARRVRPLVVFATKLATRGGRQAAAGGGGVRREMCFEESQT